MTSLADQLSPFRDQMPRQAGRVNLNAGTLSPTPRPVFEATRKLREEMACDGSSFFWGTLPPLLNTARQRLAAFVNGHVNRLLLLENVTFAMNAAIRSLPLRAGDEVLATDQCYGAMRLALDKRCREAGATVRVVDLPLTPKSPDELVELFASAITEKTVALHFSHVTSPTGLVLPASSLCALARERDVWTVIDGAHAPGLIDVDLDAIGADFYGANCHKWMMAAPGCGFLHCSERAAGILEPLVVSWGEDFKGSGASADSGWGGSMWHRRHEYHGVVDRCPQATLPDVFDFRDSAGEARIRARSKELTTFARQRFAEAGFDCISANDDRLTAAMLLFEWHATPDPTWQRNPAWEAGLTVPVTHAAGRHFVRVSCAWFNMESDLDRLAEVLASAKR